MPIPPPNTITNVIRDQNTGNSVTLISRNSGVITILFSPGTVADDQADTIFKLWPDGTWEII